MAENADVGKRLDAFLHERVPQYSRSRIQSWIKQQRVLVNGAVAKPSHLLHGSESISIEPAELAPLKAEAENLPLRILYEDDDVVVVDKAAGMMVHAGAGNSRGTLVNALLHHFGEMSSIQGDVRPGIVHRLDKETSGVMVVARNDRAHLSLAQQFHDRRVEKIYLALVERIPPPAGRVETPIARDPVRRTRMTARLGHGRSALTEYQTLETFGNDAALLRVQIGTGRTHQIRVHLASIGHPVVGDRLYGAAANAALGRFFLHAHRLTFESPSTGRRMEMESALPPELEQYLAGLRGKTARIRAS